jgi:hypothetical protein
VLTGKNEWPSMKKAIDQLVRLCGPYDLLLISDQDPERSAAPLLSGKNPLKNKPTLYLCDTKGCRPAEIIDSLDDASVRAILHR